MLYYAVLGGDDTDTQSCQVHPYRTLVLDSLECKEVGGMPKVYTNDAVRWGGLRWFAPKPALENRVTKY
jgi:hypothetical protein